MRIGAEQERINRFKNLKDFSFSFYNICWKLSMANLEHSAYGLYFTEHMRNVIENGLEYTNEHL